MPKIKLEKVISFSTEDPVFPASNMLDPDPSKKWKCRTAGETSASFELQLEEAMIITGIDIGNEHSAYVEVLVSRSSSNDNYTVLLAMSSLMSPLEARQSTNSTNVRMFTYDQLSSPERDEKWDRVKIVCTQPFNRRVQYGLAFVTLSSSEAKVERKDVKRYIGKFLIRPESPPHTFPITRDKPLSAAAAIREASASPSQNLNSTKVKISQSMDKEPSTSRNRQELMYDDDDTQPNSKIDGLIETRNKEKKEKEAKEFLEGLEREAKLNKLKKEAEEKKKKEAEENKKKQDDEELKKKQVTPNKPTNNYLAGGGSSTSKESSSKRKLEKKDSPRKKPKNKKPSLPFHELLKGVVFTISGIQNPERSNMRTMALSMGAKYKPDWENSCSHLICAFVNTPKFNQVQGRGKIVTRNWIPDCYSQRKRLPWRRYALDRNDKKKPESEDEIPESNAGNSSEDAAMDANTGSDTDVELERVQKKFKRNGVILDSPSTTPSPTVADINKLTDEINGREEDLNCTTENEKVDNDHINIFDCDTEVEDDFCLKTTANNSGDESE